MDYKTVPVYISYKFDLERELTGDEADRFADNITQHNLDYVTIMDQICDDNDPSVWIAIYIRPGETYNEAQERAEYYLHRALKQALAEQMSLFAEAVEQQGSSST